MTVPPIPGRELSPEEVQPCKEHVTRLCNLSSPRFPGSQPISFSQQDILRLEQEDFWVCEKTDGLRVLMLVHLRDGVQQIFLMDRKNTYRQVTGFTFPHHAFQGKMLGDSILDGELVLDTDQLGEEVLTFLLFDALVIDGENIMNRDLTSRYGRLQAFFFKPYARMVERSPGRAPFQIAVKKMLPSYHLETVIQELPTLQHGNDGFIYTAVHRPYIPGTNEHILKWKPPHENSIDFRLEVRFPVLGNTNSPDLTAKPVFPLYVWNGGTKYSFYDTLAIEDAQWEEMKRGKEQYDDWVVEARWDFPTKTWRFMKIRDDRLNGNHRNVVEKVVKTILEPVSQEELLAICPRVKANWKWRDQAARLSQRHSIPPLPFTGAPFYQGSCIGVRLQTVVGPTSESGWLR